MGVSGNSFDESHQLLKSNRGRFLVEGATFDSKNSMCVLDDSISKVSRASRKAVPQELSHLLSNYD